MSTIQTASGLAFDYSNPVPEMISIDDIAHALSRIPRFNGHTDRFISVAQHSLIVESLVKTPENKIPALLHDAPEAYICDIPSPLKLILGNAYREVESRCWKQVCKKFSINEQLSSEIKRADFQSLAIEMWNFFPEKIPECHKLIDSAIGDGVELFNIEPMSSEESRIAFLDRFYELNQNSQLIDNKSKKAEYA